jgi:hypothetical protein
MLTVTYIFQRIEGKAINGSRVFESDGKLALTRPCREEGEMQKLVLGWGRRTQSQEEEVLVPPWFAVPNSRRALHLHEEKVKTRHAVQPS